MKKKKKKKTDVHIVWRVAAIRKCARRFFHYIAIFSNMAQRQRARYRDARYVIVNKSQQQRLNQRTHENVTDRREMETV